jgi:hypothetical protein
MPDNVHNLPHPELRGAAFLYLTFFGFLLISFEKAQQASNPAPAFSFELFEEVGAFSLLDKFIICDNILWKVIEVGTSS